MRSWFVLMRDGKKRLSLTEQSMFVLTSLLDPQILPRKEIQILREKST